MFSSPSIVIEYIASEFIQYGLSFNVYMFHGGTNFGFLSGGAYINKMHRTAVTSYGKYFLPFYISGIATL